MAAFGSAKIGVFSASAIEDPNFETNFDPTTASADYIPTGGGPAGLALDEANDRLYVLTRFDNSISAIDRRQRHARSRRSRSSTRSRVEVVEGRPFLYDAFNTSGNGEASCASCHIFGDVDSLAWNLGDPDASVTTNPNQPQVHRLRRTPSIR